MEDLLLKCLNSYKVLMDYRYHYVLGHKNKTISLTVEFPKDSFFHLAGLHKSGFAVLANRKGVFKDEGTVLLISALVFAMMELLSKQIR